MPVFYTSLFPGNIKIREALKDKGNNVQMFKRFEQLELLF